MRITILLKHIRITISTKKAAPVATKSGKVERPTS